MVAGADEVDDYFKGGKKTPPGGINAPPPKVFTVYLPEYTRAKLFELMRFLCGDTPDIQEYTAARVESVILSEEGRKRIIQMISEEKIRFGKIVPGLRPDPIHETLFTVIEEVILTL